jgi:hypothetical protein
MKQLLRVDRAWLPKERGYSIYIRPFAYANSHTLGEQAGRRCLRPSRARPPARPLPGPWPRQPAAGRARPRQPARPPPGPPARRPAAGVHRTDRTAISIVLSPVGPYFKSGLKAIGLFIDEGHVRAWPGGVGQYKIGGNYAPTIVPQVGLRRRCAGAVCWAGVLARRWGGAGGRACRARRRSGPWCWRLHAHCHPHQARGPTAPPPPPPLPPAGGGRPAARLLAGHVHAARAQRRPAGRLPFGVRLDERVPGSGAQPRGGRRPGAGDAAAGWHHPAGCHARHHPAHRLEVGAGARVPAGAQLRQGSRCRFARAWGCPDRRAKLQLLTRAAPPPLLRAAGLG